MTVDLKAWRRMLTEVMDSPSLFYSSDNEAQAAVEGRVSPDIAAKQKANDAFMGMLAQRLGKRR